MAAAAREDLDAVLIGGLEERPIVIVDYDPAWSGLFAGLALVIQEALAKGAVSIEHIGSTAVPGLAAKPIIDILLAVKDAEDEKSYLGMLQDAGFGLRVREVGHRMMRSPSKDVHIHVFSADNPAICDYLDLRKWLRVDESDRALYAATKRRLAQQRWDDMNYYAEAKTSVILKILSRAHAWQDGRVIA